MNEVAKLVMPQGRARPRDELEKVLELVPACARKRDIAKKELRKRLAAYE